MALFMLFCHYIRFNVIFPGAAFGCPAITPPRDAWVQRVEDKAIIKCNHSRESWSMVCRGTEWVGEMRNCSESGKIEGGYAFSWHVVVS